MRLVKFSLVFFLFTVLLAPGCNREKESSETASDKVEQKQKAEPQAPSEKKDGSDQDEKAVRTMMEPVLSPCGNESWEPVEAAIADNVTFSDWSDPEELARDEFIEELLFWRCAAAGNPEMYESIPVEQKIVDVIVAANGGHKFAHEFYPPGTGTTEEDVLRCDYIVPAGEARVLVVDRYLRGEVLEWPEFGDWEGYMYTAKPVDGQWRITGYQSCPADNQVEMLMEE